MQNHVNLVDLVKSFPTNIFLQNLASIQKRTSLIKFDHLAGKSEKSSISNLSTKASTGLHKGRRGLHRGDVPSPAEKDQLCKPFLAGRGHRCCEQLAAQHETHKKKTPE